MDLYEVLGVRRNATPAEIRRAYQKRARHLHPDLNPGDPIAVERFRVVFHAFEVLSDPQRRAQHDRGEITPATSPPIPEVGFEGFDFSAEVKTAGVGFRELFDPVIETGRRETPPGPSPGEDLEQTTRVTFEEALTGTSRRVHLVRQDQCPACRGKGEVAFGPVPCPRCQGSGRLRANRGHMIFSRHCPECGATGVLDRRPCASCRGEGRLFQSEWLDVQIPPGVSDGSRVRLTGCGNAGLGGGPPGDFILAIEVEGHSLYRRENEDLHCQVPVTIAEAALGGHIDVPTPDGPMTIEIPAGTQNGQRFRLRKRGMPQMDGSSRGDLFVEVCVRVPTITDDKGRQLLQELSRLHPEEPRKELLGLTAAPNGSKKA